jgi:2-phospho-L-lactate guanylyltransferase
MDAATAALRCPLVRRIVAVTNDDVARDALAAIGVDVVPDVPDNGLNAALEHAFRQIRREDARASVAAMSGDLPALRPEDLAVVFELAREPARWFVPDEDGVGTTMLAARYPHLLSPAFGADSRHRHLAGGAEEISDVRLSRLRRDVDTETHLHQALLLGVGPYTQAALARLDAPMPSKGSGYAQCRRP